MSEFLKVILWILIGIFIVGLIVFYNEERERVKRYKNINKDLGVELLPTSLRGFYIEVFGYIAYIIAVIIVVYFR